MPNIAKLKSQIETKNDAQVATTAPSSTSAKMSISSLKNKLVATSITTPLERVRIGKTPTALTVFSDQVEKATIHYLDLPEKRGYVLCNGQGCPLCETGNKPTTRILIPAYNLMSFQVEVLAISEATNPHAPLPQILPAFDETEPSLLMVTRNFSKYKVQLRPAPGNIDMGQSAIETFNTAFDNGEIKLNSIYPILSNEELAALPSIKMMLLLNGHSGAI